MIVFRAYDSTLPVVEVTTRNGKAIIQEAALPDGTDALLVENEGVILIGAHCSMKDKLGGVIHELIHLQMPDLNEEAVCDLEDVLTDALWIQGWRLPKEESA